MIEKKLRTLFDFQKFINNEKMSSLISSTQSHFPVSLSEDELAYVNAAGAPEIMAYTGEKDPMDQN